MSGHRVRSDMAVQDVSRVSNVSGELIDDGRREFGAYVQIETNGVETRKLAEPSMPQQRLVLCMTKDGGNCTVDAPTGTDFNGAGADQLTFADLGDAVVLESFHDASGNLAWRVALNIGAVGVA